MKNLIFLLRGLEKSYKNFKNQKAVKERQKEGNESAKRRGQKFGRPRIEIDKKFIKIYNRWRNKDITAKEARNILKISKTTFYSLVKRYESQGVQLYLDGTY